MLDDTTQQRVKSWMQRIGQETPEYAGIPDMKTLLLRFKLINEEYNEAVFELSKISDRDSVSGYRTSDPLTKEFQKEIVQKSVIKLAKELADLLVVVYGTFTAFGLNGDVISAFVMDENNKKVAEGIFNDDGKLIVPTDVKAKLKEETHNRISTYVKAQWDNRVVRNVNVES